MKLRTLRPLNEGAEDFAAIIKSKCGPWLSRYGFTGVPLYRGIEGSGDNLFIRPVRQDRKPRNSSIENHNLLIDFIERMAKKAGVESGVANRHNSAFCYSANSAGSANKYAGNGEAYYYLPVGEFRTTYIIGVHDLFPIISMLRDRASDDEELMELFVERYGDKVVFDDLSNVGGYEIMVRSIEGLYLPSRYIDEVGELL